MNKSEISARISEEIVKTETLINEYKEFTKPISPDDSIGRISRMDAINNKSVMESALRQAEHKLKQLQHILSNLDQPDFGLCLRCKKPIPLGRILIKPESPYCVNCAR